MSVLSGPSDDIIQIIDELDAIGINVVLYLSCAHVICNLTTPFLKENPILCWHFATIYIGADYAQNYAGIIFSSLKSRQWLD